MRIACLIYVESKSTPPGRRERGNVPWAAVEES